MRVIILALTCVAAVATLTGCASIAGDNSRAVRVTSHPAGAQIYVDNQNYGKTPAVVNLPSYIYGGKSITLKKPGYQDQSAMVNTKFQAISLVNLLFPAGFIVDAVTGNIVKIDPADRVLHYQLDRA